MIWIEVVGSIPAVVEKIFVLPCVVFLGLRSQFNIHCRVNNPPFVPLVLAAQNAFYSRFTFAKINVRIQSTVALLTELRGQSGVSE